MTKWRIVKCTLVLGSLFLATEVWAQADKQPHNAPTTKNEVRLVSFEEEKPDSIRLKEQKKIPLLAGVSVSGDLLGLLLSAVSSYGQIEGGIRLNLKQTYFPTLELGLGISDHTNDITDLHYKTHSPYFRIGADYNFARDKQSGNRVFGGIRYGFSSFSFDLSGRPILDPIWKTETSYDFKGLKSTVHWCELVFGLEAKIWGNLHIGWTGRYRKRLSQTESAVGHAWYVPGYGKNNGHVFSGTINLILDI